MMYGEKRLYGNALAGVNRKSTTVSRMVFVNRVWLSGALGA